MEKIMECVPNFSEGRKPDIIEAILAEIKSVGGVALLNSEMDKDYNRTVVTFVGEPGKVSEAAFRATKKAAELIDMTAHMGEHPRMGATDVVPFIPVQGVTMDECVAEAKSYGQRVGKELGLPVYLYELAATKPDRRNLAEVRKGQYEGLAEKLKDPTWKPDYGPSSFVPKTGAVITGARKFLIAYNVNLDTADIDIAKAIGENVRESGKILKDDQGNKVLGEDGKPKKVPGRLKAVKGMGVMLEAHNITQVSMNLVDYEITPPHKAFDVCAEEAEKLGAKVTGSEVVGVIPKESLLMAAKHYASKEGITLADEKEMLDYASAKLGLNQLSPFVLEEKVIEYMI
ncbi:MAG: glutamate formimidoyltransferase [Candidatus Thermoplasmatota archaeon]|nr:glutamate formimidoyltransferase [Candidatus Thermoplasmatota archaeon]